MRTFFGIWSDVGRLKHRQGPLPGNGAAPGVSVSHQDPERALAQARGYHDWIPIPRLLRSGGNGRTRIEHGRPQPGKSLPYLLPQRFAVRFIETIAPALDDIEGEAGAVPKSIAPPGKKSGSTKMMQPIVGSSNGSV